MNTTRTTDRRGLLHGRWINSADTAERSATEIAGILVQARPDRLEIVACAVAALPHTQIYSRDPRGKFVAVIEAPTVGRIGETLNTISSMPDVLNAALVFQGTASV